MIERLLKLSISIVFYTVYRGIILIYLLLKKPFPATIAVLMYHSLKSEQRSRFEKHMDELIKAGRPVRANILGPLMKGQHHIAVTFDDGYQSVLNNALPILIARKIPATIFVTTGYLGAKPGWIHNPDHENINENILTEEQLKQIPDDLITIGSHSVTHPHLASIGKDDAFKELIESKKTLEDMLHTDITLLSLPYGSINKEIIDMAKRAGYKHIYLNIPSLPFSKVGEYVIGRINISLDDWLIEYHLKLLGAYQWLFFAIIFKRKLINLVRLMVRRKLR